MTRLIIHAAGPGATLQDGGRYGYLRYGLSAAGPMDWRSHGRANILAGNPQDGAAIEVGLGGIEIGARSGAVSIGYAGGPFSVMLNGQALPAAGCVRLGQDERLSVKAGRSGAWFYLSPSGGFDLTPVMGSLSTSLRSGIGGLNGRALAAGDELPLGEAALLPELGYDERPVPVGRPIRVLAGPQDDYFTDAGLAQFFSADFRLAARSDRMGYRLDGPAIEHARGFNIVSDGISLGAIQVPGDGKPIVLMADRQSTGGYPKIGYVIRADIGRLAQLRAGESLRFAQIDIAGARAELFAALSELRRSRKDAYPLGVGKLTSEFLLSQNLISGARGEAEEN